MKKFLLKSVMAIGILIGLLCLLNGVYTHTDYYKNLNDMGKFLDVPEHIDVANFGASHSTLAFDWSEYSEQFQGMNMGLGSQTYVYDLALFEYYADCFDETSTVIVDVMFKSLYEAEPSEKPYPPNITRYYQILPKKYIKQWNILDAMQYQYFPILGNRQNAIENIEWEMFSHKAESISASDNSSVGSALEGEPTQVLDGWEKEDMLAEGKRRAESFMNQSGEQVLGEQYEALIQMIELCKEKGIQIVLVTVPTLPCHYESFTDEFMEKFYQDLKNICETYDVQYFDYTGDERFLTDYRWFRDTDHFNEIGAKVFTRQFLQDNKDILQIYQ